MLTSLFILVTFAEIAPLLSKLILKFTFHNCCSSLSDFHFLSAWISSFNKSKFCLSLTGISIEQTGSCLTCVTTTFDWFTSNRATDKSICLPNRTKLSGINLSGVDMAYAEITKEILVMKIWECTFIRRQFTIFRSTLCKPENASLSIVDVSNA